MAEGAARGEYRLMMKTSLKRILPLTLLSLLFGSGPVAAKPWGIRLIPSPTGAGATQIRAINAQGVVVGEHTAPGQAPRAFVNRGGVSTVLPVPDGTTGSGACGTLDRAVIGGRRSEVGERPVPTKDQGPRTKDP